MTGDRKWKAVEMPSGFWELHDEDGYALLEDLTETEARDIAGIDRIKAERDEAVRFVRKFVSWFAGGLKRAPVESAQEFITSIKEGEANA